MITIPRIIALLVCYYAIYDHLQNVHVSCSYHDHKIEKIVYRWKYLPHNFYAAYWEIIFVWEKIVHISRSCIKWRGWDPALNSKFLVLVSCYYSGAIHNILSSRTSLGRTHNIYQMMMRSYKLNSGFLSHLLWMPLLHCITTCLVIKCFRLIGVRLIDHWPDLSLFWA